ncbi:hypothetical protein KKI17_00505 [Patescibacteria group bacterium]|nr:hypothetical protein [Patescibacteria group bacterium]
MAFFNWDALKALAIATIVLVVGLFVLVWQYNRLAEERLSKLETQIQEQQEAIEEQKAENVLTSFLVFRVAGDEGPLRSFLTERAAQQLAEGKILAEGVAGYEILGKQDVGEDTFRFQVNLKLEGPPFTQVEIIFVEKLLDHYYVDSVELAG